MENYQYLKREIERLWKLKKVEVVPVVIGALGSVTKGFDRWIEKLGITSNVGVMQTNCTVRNCKDIEENVGNVKKRLFCYPWSFVMTRLTEKMTAMITART